MEGRIGVEDPLYRWYNILQQLLSHAWPDTCFSMVNSAVGGESTREIMQRLECDVLSYNPHYCLFMAGANNHDYNNPHRILVEGEFQSLLETYAERLPQRTQTIGVVLNPVVDDWHFVTRDTAYQEFLTAFGGSLDASLQQERDTARDFYIQNNWPCLDLYALMSEAPEKYVMPQDGIHLNRAGHELFAQKMFDIFRSLL